MKRYIIAVLALSALSASPVKADTSLLTTADGWTKITTVPTASEIANNYYVFVDATSDLMLGIGKGVENTKAWYSLALYYRNSVSPTSKDITPMVWTLESNGGGFSMRNLDQPVHLFQTEYNAAWYFDTNDVTSSNSWSKVNLAISDGKWTLENGTYTDKYIGPWNDNNFTNGAECAANKTTALRGYFYIYAISRAQFKQNLLDNASASNPVDLTPWYVSNATFDSGNRNNWTDEGNDGNNNTHARGGGCEIWHRSSFNIHQDVAVPNGKYKVSLQMAGTTGAGKVYGTSNGTSKEAASSAAAGDNFQLTILSMIQDRTYGQTITDEITVSNGALTIGMKCETTDQWLNFDNFKLYCTGIDLSAYQSQLSDLVQECNTFIGSGMVPDACENVISEAVTTYNQTYSTAKEYSSAIIALTAVLDTYRNDAELQSAYAAYKAMRTDVQELENTTLYKYTDPGTAKSTFDDAVSSANTAVESATTASAINTQTGNIRAAALTFVSSVTAEDGNPFNLTFLASTAAADWQTASGLNPAATAPAWSVPKPDASMADFVESYTEATGGESITGNILYQTVSGMPAGYYTVALYAAASYTPNRGSLVVKCTDGQPNITFGFAGDNSLSLPVAHRSSLTAADQVPVNLSVQLTAEGPLTFGIKKTAAGSNWHVAQIYTITYSKDPDLTVLKADRDALVSEAEGLLASGDASLLTTAQQNALSTAIATAEAAVTFETLTEVTLNTLPNAIQTARQQIQLVKDNRVLMIAVLERFENDYNLADGTDYRRVTMSADAWASLITKVNAVSTALDDVSLSTSYGTIKDALIAQMDATDASLRLFKSYKAMADGVCSVCSGITAATAETDTDASEQAAITAYNTAFVDYATTQSDNFSVSAFLGANLDFSAAEGEALNTGNSNDIHAVSDWEVAYADADSWTVLQTKQSENTDALYMRKNWGSAATTLTVAKQKMLPVGKYTLSFKWNSDMKNMTNRSQYKIGTEYVTIGKTTNGAEELTYDFEITGQPQPFDLVFSFQKTGTGNTPAQMVVDDIVLTYVPTVITLADKAENADAIRKNAGKRGVVTLQGRTLIKDGSWNTLCLPFSMTAEQVTAQLAPAALMELDIESNADYAHQTGLDGNTLYLNFKTAESIQAGTPYIIKWNKANDYEGKESDYDIANPVFRGVTVLNGSPGEVNSADRAVTFQGTYDPVSLTKDDPSNLYLGDGNTLYYPNVEDFKVNAFRAYFHLSAPNAARFVLNFGDGTTNGIAEMENGKSEGRKYYDLQGRGISGQPAKAGIYIINGKKIIVR